VGGGLANSSSPLKNHIHLNFNSVADPKLFFSSHPDPTFQTVSDPNSGS
jgi:hypothetical protein